MRERRSGPIPALPVREGVNPSPTLSGGAGEVKLII